jgi:predicted membrane protein
MKMDSKKIEEIVPSYNQVVDEIVAQIKSRSKDILKRALVVVWPYLILFVLVFAYVFSGLRESVENYPTLLATFLAFFVLWLLFSIIYSSVIRILFELEKVIWIDSYFDKKNLKSKNSILVAKKLFWLAAGKKVQLFFQFYFIPITLYVLLMIWGLYMMSSEQNLIGSSANIVFWIIVFGGLGFNFVYFYYLDIKLRYFWFIFLDYYGSDKFSYRKIIKETKKLGKVNEDKIFKKTFFLLFGADALNQLSRSITNTIVKQLGSFGTGANATGKAMKTYSDEVLYQITSLSKITAKYVFYLHARKKSGLAKYHINHNIYNIIK